MNKQRKSSKIDVSTKIEALQLYKQGHRLSVISKKIGYSEPTIKYWLKMSHTILPNETMEKLNASFHAAQNMEFYDSNEKRQSDVSDLSNVKRMRMSDTQFNQRFLSNDYEPHRSYNGIMDHSPSSTKETETMRLQPSPLLECHSLNRTNQFEQLCLTSRTEEDDRKFKRDAANVQETIEELVEYIASGKRLLNKAANMMYQLQETMNEYDIKKKTKFEFN